jgi:hypothetical protein
MLVVGSGQCSMSVLGKLEGKVFRFGRDENRTVEFDIHGVVGFVWEQDFPEASINSALIVDFEEINEFSS